MHQTLNQNYVVDDVRFSIESVPVCILRDVQ